MREFEKILPVEEYTTPSPITAKEDTLIDELNLIMSEHGIRHIPIVRGEKVVGIVSDRDLRVVTGLRLNEDTRVRAQDIMVPDPVTVSVNDSLDHVAFIMSDKKIGSVIVNDEDGSFLGIFTVTDALNALIEIGRTIQSRH